MTSLNNCTNTVQTLAEVFQCYICMENLRDAHLCPHCSKLCCYPCIRRWLTDHLQKCPHCCATLHLHDLVKCRWIEDVTAQLDNLKATETNKPKLDEKDRCTIHKEKLSVYCLTCSTCICHQCALFNGTHNGHHFQPLDDVHQKSQSTIHEHLKCLHRRHVEFACLIQDIERNIANVNKTKEEKVQEIQNILYLMERKLDGQAQFKLEHLNAQRTKLIHEKENVSQTLESIENFISTSAKCDLISKQQDLINRIQNVCQSSIKDFIAEPISCYFSSELFPEYNSSTFIITNFSLRQQNLDPIYSHLLHVYGLTWRLKVYPIGNETVRGTHLSVFLELVNGLCEPSKYEYRIEMLNQLTKDASKNLIREFASDFENGECWGYNKFCSLDALITDGFIDTNIDMLVIRFQVRSPTYYQQSRDQDCYIKKLEQENLQLHNEIKMLQEQLRTIDDDVIDNEYKENESNSNIRKHRSITANNNDNLTSAIIKSLTSNMYSDDTDNEVESAFISPKHPIIPTVLQENYILADILERSANNESGTND